VDRLELDTSDGLLIKWRGSRDDRHHRRRPHYFTTLDWQRRIAGSCSGSKLDSADAAKSLLTTRGFAESEVDAVWTAIALHTTPEVPYKMAPAIAGTTAGAETSTRIRLDRLAQNQIDVVTAVKNPAWPH
jgi:hypothetical protein